MTSLNGGRRSDTEPPPFTEHRAALRQLMSTTEVDVRLKQVVVSGDVGKL